jgi:hypothetical protein
VSQIIILERYLAANSMAVYDRGASITTKNTENHRVSTVPVTVDTRPDGCLFCWPRGHMRRRNNWPRVLIHVANWPRV